MMYKIKVLFLLIIFFFILCNLSIDVLSSPKNEEILIVYDRLTKYTDQRSQIVLLEEILCHFDVSVHIVDESDYKEGMIERYDFIFLVSLEERFGNEYLKEDIKKSSKRFYFIGDIGDEYYPYLEDILKINGKISGINEYYDEKDRREQIDFFQTYNNNKMTLTTPKYETKKGYFNDIISITDGHNIALYLFNDAKNYFAAGFNIDTNLFYHFIDSLFEIFSENEKYNTEIYCIIDEIRPFSDINKLREKLNKFIENDIKIFINLTPTYVDEETYFLSTLDSDPLLTEEIRKFKEYGVEILLNGYSYTDKDNYITYNRSEFWDMKSDMAYINNIDNLYNEKYNEAVRLFFYNEIYPNGVTVYNDAVPLIGYKKIKEIFSSYYGKMQISITGYGTYPIPLKIYDSEYFNKYYPVTIDFSNEDFEKSIIEFDKYIKNHKFIRNSTIGVRIKGDLFSHNLDRIIEIIKANNINKFKDEKEIDWIEIGDIQYRIDSLGQTSLEGYSRKTDKVVKQRTLFMTATNVLIIIVSIICSIFIILFFISRIRSRKNLFIKERESGK